MYSSNYGSPIRSSPIRAMAERQAAVGSPVSSPLKQPRNTESYGSGSADYVPVSRADIIGKPIEIIQGKYSPMKSSNSINCRQTVLGVGCQATSKL